MFMFSRKIFVLTKCCAFSCAVALSSASAHAACVWKVSDAGGHTLYLGGSIHSLQSTDYPLPSAYNRAFDLSNRIVFEDDGKASPYTIRRFLKSGEYSKSDTLK